jgi:hypothetical protein
MKYFARLFILAVLLSTSSLALRASVTLNLAAETLSGPGDEPLAADSLVLLVASTEDGEFDLSALVARAQGLLVGDSFGGEDDLIVWRGDLSSTINAEPGILAQSVFIEDILPAGTPLALVWFPTLSSAAEVIDTEVPYGFHTAADWRFPADGATLALQMLTTDATVLGSGILPVRAGQSLELLEFLEPVSFNLQPESITAIAGAGVSLNVQATGSGPFDYQWYLGQSGDTTKPLAGATDANLEIQPSATAAYWVRVGNALGQEDSATATVTVDYTLTSTAGIGGSITRSPNLTQYSAGAVVTLTAAPSSGYLFDSWSGDASGSSNALQINMDRHRTITAQFVEDGNDDDEDGLSNFEELITYNTNPSVKDSSGDGLSDGEIVAIGLDPNYDYSSLVGLIDPQVESPRSIPTKIKIVNGNVVLSLEIQLERSNDLTTWTQEPAEEISFEIPITADQEFFRFKL